MRQFGLHVDLVQTAMNDINASLHRDEIVIASNAVMGTLAGKFPIGLLCRKLTIAAGDDAFLPANLAGITYARESDTGRLVRRRGEGAAGADEAIYRYYTDISVAAESDSALPFVAAGSIAAGANEVTCAELLALSSTVELVGHTLVIQDAAYGNYYYKITEVTVDSIVIDGNHPYTESGVQVRVRPNYSQRIHFVDDSEAEISSTNFDVYYWILPNPMSLDSDIIPLMYPDALEVMTIRRIPQTKDRRPVSKSEIEDAIKIASRAEPDQSIPVQPLTDSGNPFTMSSAFGGNSKYKARGD